MKPNNKNIIPDLVLSDTTIKSITKQADSGDLIIEGYANTTTKDRVGDIVLSSAFNLTDYEKNPIVLFNHDANKPIGKMIDYSVDDKGLLFKAVISSTAEKLYGLQSLIKDSIVRAFSIGFKFIDGNYDSKSETFFITKLELLEVSVVSIPANQDSIFEISKGLKEIMMDKKTLVDVKAVGDSVTTITTTTNTVSDSTENENEKEVTTIEVVGDPVVAAAALAGKAASNTAIKADTNNGGTPTVGTTTVKETTPVDVSAIVSKELDARKADDLKAQKDLDVQAEKEVSAKKELNTTIAAAVALAMEAQADKAKADLEKDLGIPTNRSTIESVVTTLSSIDKERYTKDIDNLYLLAIHLGKDLTKLSAFAKLPEQIQKAVTDTGGLSLAPVGFDTRLEADVRKLLKVEPMFGKFNMPLADFRLPFNAHGISAAWTAPGVAPADSTEIFENILFTAKKLMAAVLFNYEDEDDAVIALLPTIREDLAYAIAELIDTTLVVGTGAAADFRGISHYATGANVAGSHITTIVGGAAAAFTVASVAAARAKMGRYGISPRNIRMLINITDYYSLIEDAAVKTVQNFGQDVATLRTGELANIYGVEIVPTEAIATPAAVGDLRACIVRPDRFKLGNRGSFMIETYREPRSQTKVLTASRRMDFNPLVPLTAGQLTATETFVHNITVAI